MSAQSVKKFGKKISYALCLNITRAYLIKVETQLDRKKLNQTRGQIEGIKTFVTILRSLVLFFHDSKHIMSRGRLVSARIGHD